MKAFYVLFAVALGVSTSCLGAETKECDTTGADEGSVTVLELHSPEQLDAFEGCTILNGHIIIQSDYDGDFSLNGVTTVNGNISTVDEGAEYLNLFEMQDLENIDHLHLLGISGDVNIPNLESLGDLELVQTSTSGNADLTALAEADNLSVRGSWTSTKFSSLKTVTVQCQFCGSQTCEIYGDERKFPYITVNLPSLEKADKLEVAGAVKSVSLPKLEVVGYIPWVSLFFNQGLRINMEDGYDEKLHFDAPNLHTLNGSLEVYGGVASVSLGSLSNTTVGATLNTMGSPLDFYSTIETAKSFYIWGELHSIYLPNMVDLGTVALSYTPRIACNDTLYQLWKTQSDDSSDYDDYNSCINYDYPQDGGVGPSVSATISTAATSTPGNHASTATSGLSNQPTTSGSPAQSTDTASKTSNGTGTETPKNGAGQSFSTSLIGSTLTVMILILVNFC